MEGQRKEYGNAREGERNRKDGEGRREGGLAPWVQGG